MILGMVGKALAQLSDPRFRWVLIKGLALTIALLVAAYVLVLWVLGALLPETLALPFVGEVGWVDDAVGWGSLALMLLASVFLMVPVASAMTSLFLEEVAEAVEARHYPTLPRVSPVPWGEALRETFGFLGLLVGANLLAFVAYLMVPFAAPVIFYALNGFLLGREYFQVAAIRREGRAEALKLYRRHRGTVFVAGCLMAVPLTVPVVNLLVPILGAATFTHLYHRLTGHKPAP